MLLVARPKLGNDTEVRASLQATTTASIEPNEIGQVILNLLFNAADVVRGASEGTITIRVSEDDDGHTIDVIDDGPGIPEADQTRIFTPFFTTKHTGTGLGLTVSHAIVRAHNGQLTFDTNPRTGTRFRVRIPRDITIPEESR
jgi:signal transduction histidine kinase